MKSNARRERIVVLVRAAGELSVEDLSEKTGVSSETIRRDLTKLDEEGLIRKFHGGARTIRPSPNNNKALGYSGHMREYAVAQRALCATVAKILKAADTLFINSGSTAVFFAQTIADFLRLMIVTNSSSVADIVSANPHHDVFLLGGSYKRERN